MKKIIKQTHHLRNKLLAELRQKEAPPATIEESESPPAVSPRVITDEELTLQQHIAAERLLHCTDKV